MTSPVTSRQFSHQEGSLSTKEKAGESTSPAKPYLTGANRTPPYLNTPRLNPYRNLPILTENRKNILLIHNA